ncbi:MAG: hypothetical protein K8T89_17110, partial [Planctomycetes bacterium]|nr:hypothetical protein [Planctomycetota bacterium]
KKAITRFFVPMIDVLILLFCIFLLMPIMNVPGAADSPETQAKRQKTTEEMFQEIDDLKIELERARATIKKFKDEQINPAETLHDSILEIDPKDGKLFFFRNSKRLEIDSERTALEVIDAHKRSTPVGKFPNFIIIMPRELVDFPTKPQLDTYKKWFKDAPHRFDNPLGSN